MLLDHDPIILTIKISPRDTTSNLKKFSYFKANLGILKRAGSMEALWVALIAHPSGVSDPTLKFTFAWYRLRKVLKTIQE